MNKPMVIMLTGCLVLFGAIFGFKGIGVHFMNKMFDEMGAPPATVAVADVKQATWARSLSAVGDVRAVNGTALTMEAAGIVSRIQFRSGDFVSANSELLKLDDRADRAQLDALRAAEQLARLERDRLSQLHQQGSVSRAELDRANTQYEQARANAKSQQAMVAQKTLRAPFDGQLGLRQVDLGQYLSPGTAIVNLQQLDPVYIEFSLPEKHLGKLKEDMAVTAELDSIPGEPFSGHITAIEPGVDLATRNVRLQASFANPDHQLRPGMFARVNIDLGESDDVLIIPRTAVSFNPYGNAVFVVTEQQNDAGDSELVVNRRFIRTGQARGDFITVQEGLEVGERVASSGLLKLGNNTRITINNDVGPQPQLDPKPDNS